jgi:hypothetical protein
MKTSLMGRVTFRGKRVAAVGITLIIAVVLLSVMVAQTWAATDICGEKGS